MVKRSKGVKKIILDLCGGTGSWSKPYKNASYDVKLITLPKFDILRTRINYNPSGKRLWFLEAGENENPKLIVKVSRIYGILAAPPCTMFSHARTSAKEPRDVAGAMEIVYNCLKIIWECQYDVDTGEKKTPLKFWALENPFHGILKNLLGKPAFTFDPYEFGDGYKKRTALWGYFNNPVKLKKLATPRSSWSSKKFDRLKSHEIHGKYFGEYDRQTRRAITPEGFAKAFFEANK